jgi:hypothetical protein
MTDKYSGYITKEIPLTAPVSVSTILTSTLEQPDANYHPTLPRSASFVPPPKRVKNEMDYFDNEELILPVCRDQLPKSIHEATDTYFQNMYISLGDFQMLQERLKGFVKEDVSTPFSVIEAIFVSAFRMGGSFLLHANSRLRKNWCLNFKLFLSFYSNFYYKWLPKQNKSRWM